MNSIQPARKNRKTIWIILLILLLMILIGLGGFLLSDRADKKLAGHKQRGSEYLLKDNYLKAKEEFQKAIKLNPGNLVLYFQLAESLIGLKEYDNAASYLEQAIVIAEEGSLDILQYESLVIKLAECYEITGEDQKRVELLEHSLEITGSERIKELLEYKRGI